MPIEYEPEFSGDLPTDDDDEELPNVSPETWRTGRIHCRQGRRGPVLHLRVLPSMREQVPAMVASNQEATTKGRYRPAIHEPATLRGSIVRQQGRCLDLCGARG